MDTNDVHRTKQLVIDLEYLRAAGLTVKQLRSLHHWSDRDEAAKRVTFTTAINYFSKGQELEEKNSVFAERLRFIADSHQRGFAVLVELTLTNYPI